MTMGYKETLGDRIKKVRKELGLSLDTLAAKSDITKGHLRMLEVSATQPSIRNLRKIAEALGVNAGYLVDGFSVKDEETKSFIEKFSLMSDDYKKRVLRIIDNHLKRRRVLECIDEMIEKESN